MELTELLSRNIQGFELVSDTVVALYLNCFAYAHIYFVCIHILLSIDHRAMSSFRFISADPTIRYVTLEDMHVGQEEYVFHLFLVVNRMRFNPETRTTTEVVVELRESLIMLIDDAFPGGEPVVVELRYDSEERLRYRLMRLEDVQPDKHPNVGAEANGAPA